MSAAAPAASASQESTPALRIAPQSYVDVAVLTLLSVIGIIGFSTSFQDLGWLLAGLGGLLVGTAAGFGSHFLRLGAVTTTLLALVAFFLFGSAFAVPEDAILGVIPTLDSLANLAVGAVYGWADVLTLRAPVELPDYVTAVPFLATWVVGLVTTVLAVRWLPRHKRTAWRGGLMLIGPLVLYLAGVLLGTDEPFFAALRGISFAGVALIWIGWRRGSAHRVSAQGNRQLLRKKLVGTGILVIVAALVGAIVGGAIAPVPDNRFVLREEIEPPFEPLEYPSPFAAYRKYTKTLEETVLFSVEGLKPDQRLRLATLDTYDGIIWGVAGSEIATDGSGSFRLVGRDMPKAPLITNGDASELDITIADYADVWIPSIGYPATIVFDGDDPAADAAAMRYNSATGTAVLTTGLAAGDEYTVDAVLQKTFDTESLLDVPVASLTLPPVSNIPDVITSKAAEMAGDATTPIERLRNIEETLQTTGFLSHGAADDAVASRAGQGADRMVELFTRTQLVGDEEQYASAFALMARSFNYPARVVMGFAPEVTADGASVDVLGADVTAWVEVAFEGVGWVPFYPTPDETDIPQDQNPKPQSEPQPQVRQPPRTENEQNDLVAGVEIDDSDKDEDSLFQLPGWVIVLGLSILIPLAVIFLPMLAIALVKARRRRKRRAAARGDIAIGGAWDEVVDQYSELGYTAPENTTRRGVASGLQQQVGESPVSLLELARAADYAVFSGADVPPEQADRVWTEADASVAAARAATTRLRRILSRYRVSSARALLARVAAKAAEDAPRRKKR